MGNRYDALYVGSIFDGIYDNEIEKYLDMDTVIRLLNLVDDDYDSIWEDEVKNLNEKYEELHRRYRDDPYRKTARKFLKLFEDGLEKGFDNLQKRGVIQKYIEEAVKEVMEKEYGKKED